MKKVNFPLMEGDLNLRISVGDEAFNLTSSMLVSADTLGRLADPTGVSVKKNNTRNAGTVGSR